MNVNSVSGGKSAKEDEDGHDNTTENKKFAKGWSAGTEICPLTSTFGKISLNLFSAKLKPDHSTKSNSVSETLEWSDEGSPNDDGKADEKNILQNTTEGEDKNGGFTDL